MKNLIILCTLFLSTVVMGQGNLQFNRVVDTSFNTSNYSAISSHIVSGTLTVPAGKVIKIEDVSNYSYNGYLYRQNSNGVFVGNHFLEVYGSTATSWNDISGPLWLPEGTYDIKVRRNSTSGTETINTAISGIEFNVVP